MRRLLFAALFALVALPAHAQQARVVTACGSLAPFGPQVAGGSALPTVDVNGKLCIAGGGAGGIAVPPSGTTPITGTCPSGQFLYNNAGVVGCSASSASIAFPQAVTSGVSGGIPYFSNTNTMSASALLLSNYLMVGGGAGAAPATVTTGTGVVTALGANTNAGGGVALVNTVPTNGNLVKWSATGIVDGGAGSSTITAGTTATSGFAAGQLIMSDGSNTQPASGAVKINNNGGTPWYQWQGGIVGAELGFGLDPAEATPGAIAIWMHSATHGISILGNDPLNSFMGFAATTGNFPDAALTRAAASSIGVHNINAPTTATSFRAYNTYTDASNGEWGALDWQTTANVLLVGVQVNGTGTLRPVQIVGSNFRVPSLTSIGTKPTVTGSGGTCATSTTVGGALAGTFQTSAVCAAGNTVALTGMPATATGYACDATDRTLPAALFQQTASSTTGATFTVAGSSTAASNVVSWKCMGY